MSSTPLTALLHHFRASSVFAEQCDRALSAAHGLALSETLLLMHLERADGGRLSRIDLAKRLNASPSTVTRMAQPLEKLGLVGRAPDPRDARLAYVVLTDAGRSLARYGRETLQRVAEDLFAESWSEDEVAGLAMLLGRLTAGHPGRILGG